MERMRSGIAETVKRHKVASTFAGSVLLLETAGFATNPVWFVPKDACESPIAKTSVYVDHGGNSLKTNAGVGEGVVVNVTLPEHAVGVVAGWTDAGKERWTSSGMVPATGRVALKFGIGQGDVEFGVRTVSRDPADCVTPPAIDVDFHDATSYYYAPGQVSWPNGVNNIMGLMQHAHTAYKLVAWRTRVAASDEHSRQFSWESAV